MVGQKLIGGGGHVVTGCTMSTNDDTQNTTTMNMTWTDVNKRGQIVTRPRRFRGLTHREGFADYVEQAYWVAQRMRLLEELAALPYLEGMAIPDIADLTRSLGVQIRSRMRSFHDGNGPNVYYGALIHMVEAAKEDVNPTTAKEVVNPTTAKEDVNPTTTKEVVKPEPAPEPAPETNMVVSTSLPTLPTSPLIRQTGAAVAETMSDSEIELGRAALRDIKWSIAASTKAHADDVNDSDIVIRSAAAAVADWTDISGQVRPGGGGFIRLVSGVGDKGPLLPFIADEDRDSDEDSVSVDDGDEADTEDAGDDHEVSEDELLIQPAPAPAPAPAVLHQNIGLEWAWLAILAAFAVWAALVNGVLSRDLGCRVFR